MSEQTNNPNENDDKEEIMEHVEERNDKSNVTCEFCDKTFVNLKDVKLHAYQDHASAFDSTKVRKKCGICKRNLHTFKGWVRHFKEDHSEKEIRTQLSPEDQAQIKICQFNVFLSNIDTGENYPCEKCGKIFHLKSKLTAHTSKAGIFKCIRCGETFDFSCKLTRHQEKAHPEQDRTDSGTCHICGKLAKNLASHIYTVHTRLTVHCQFCPKSLPNENLLKSHIANVHGGSKDYVCDTCGQAFAIQEQLDRHFVRFHTNALKVVCDLCGKSFKNKEGLSLHIKQIHDESTKVTCNICGKILRTKKVLKLHMKRIHERPNNEGEQPLKPRPWKCEKCDKCFPTKKTRTSHDINVHREYNVLKCHLCDFKTRYKVMLSDHISYVHEGIKKYPCEHCEKRFPTIYKKNDHIWQAHGGWTCIIDNAHFTKFALFKRHYKQLHNGVNPGIVVDKSAKKENQEEFKHENDTKEIKSEQNDCDPSDIVRVCQQNYDLAKFLWDLLQEPVEYSNIIQWVHEENEEFILKDIEGIGILWEKHIQRPLASHSLDYTIK